MRFFKLFLYVTTSIIIPVYIIFSYIGNPKIVVRNVNINPNIDFVDKELVKYAAEGIYQKPILAIDTRFLEKDISLRFRDIKRVKVLVIPPDKINIDVEYKVPVVKLKTQYSGFVFLDSDLNPVKEYKKSIFDNLPTILVETTDYRVKLSNIVDSLSQIDPATLKSYSFPEIFIIRDSGIYAFNTKYKIMIFFGNDIDYRRLNRSYLTTKYIIQKKLPTRYIDARYDTFVAK